MAKERKPDIDTPKDDVERHVDQMLDPSLPDAPAEPAPAPEPTAKKINVLHDDALSEEPASAPEIPSETPAKKSLKISIQEHEEETPEPEAAPAKEAEPVITAPELEPAKDGPAEAEVDETPAEESTEEAATESEANEPEPAQELEEAEAPAEEAAEPQPDPLEDKEIDKAVDEIIASESDALLEAEDEKLARKTQAPPKASFGERVKDFFGGWWHNPITRWLTILLVVGTIGAAGVLPTTRYLVLNNLGVRSAASVQVIDQSTLQPLKNVQVELGGASALTNDEGQAAFEGLKLGPAQMVIKKRAFAQVTENVTIGWGSNPFGSRELSPTGTQYAFIVTDYLSGKPVAKVAAKAEDADAQSDDKGNIRLTLDHAKAAEKITVTISAGGYRTEKMDLDLDSKEQVKLQLVPARKSVFISKRSGKYDVYKVDIDGKNEELVLAGSGNERDDMVLASHPTDELVALVSTRENKRNADGYLLSTLTLINLNDNSNKAITSSEQIKIVNWVSGRLVYVQVASGASAANPNRQRLMSYDPKASDNKQIATTNYFNDVLSVGGKIYYAPSSTYQSSPSLANFYSINADGTSKQTIVQGETWNAFRSEYNKLVLSLPNQWYEFGIGSAGPAKLDGQPGNLKSRSYTDSPDGKRSAWLDMRDGKSVLLLYDIAAKKDTVLQTKAGLKMPVRWLNNNVLLYRIQNDQETADYVLSLEGGEPKKVKDVTNTGGVDSWYYY